jgi:N-acetylmuramoyl-L-alanine amidase
MTRVRATVALAVLVIAPPLAAQSVTVAIDGVPRDVPVIERQGRQFVALVEVARLLGGNVLAAGPERAVLIVDQARMTVHRRSPFVQFDGRWYQMIEAAQKDGAGFYLPASSLSQLLPTLWPGRFPTAPDRGSIDPRSPPADNQRAPPAGGVESGMIGLGGSPTGDDLPRVDFWAEPGRTRLGFRLATAPGIVVDDAFPGTLQLLLSGTTISPDLVRGLVGVGLVDSVAVAPATSDRTALTLWLDPRTSVYAVAPLRRPAGFEVVLRSGAADEAAIMLGADVNVRRPAVVSSTDRSPDPVTQAPPSSAPDRKQWTIVLDAGHGGNDPGSIGPRRTQEKAVTLMVARQLSERLQRENGVRVLMTRDGDEFITLADRTRMANHENADLFVSIHANAARNGSAEGFETYFLSAAKTEDEKRVARMENSAIRYENPQIDPESLGDLNFILWDLAQNEYLRESSTLAETIQEELGRRLSLKSRGVKQAGFFVLNGAFMPAVLFEMAFISNPQEEALLNDSAFRTRLVDGLANSLLQYLSQYGQRALVRRTSG